MSEAKGEELFNSFKKLERQLEELKFKKADAEHKLYRFMFPEILKQWFRDFEEVLNIKIPAEKLESLKTTLLSKLTTTPSISFCQIPRKYGYNCHSYRVDYVYEREIINYQVSTTITENPTHSLNGLDDESINIQTFEQFENLEDKYKIAAMFSKIYHEVSTYEIGDEYLRIYKPEEYYYESSTPSRRSYASGWSSDC